MAALAAALTSSLAMTHAVQAVSAVAGAGGGGGNTTLTFLIPNDDATVASAKDVVSAFQAANPGITVTTETRPGGSEGDNVVKTPTVDRRHGRRVHL